MAAEYSANAVQTVSANQPVIFTESPVLCNRGFVFHRDESGAFRLASLVRSQGCRLFETRYTVEYHANIAIPTGGTVEEIQLAVVIDGEVDPSSIMRVTPAAVNQYGNIGTAVVVSVPSVCGCETVSIRNTSTQDVLVQNSNLIIGFEGVQRVR